MLWLTISHYKYADSIHHVQFDGNKNLVEDANFDGLVGTSYSWHLL